MGRNGFINSSLTGPRGCLQLWRQLHLRSRNDKDFTLRYPSVTKALSSLPGETVIDGDIVALDERGRPSFKVLQNYASSTTPLLYYVFDVMMLSGKNVMGEPLEHRRELLEKAVLPKLKEPIRHSSELKGSLGI